MGGGIAGDLTANDPVPAINADMALITVYRDSDIALWLAVSSLARLGELHRSTGINILLAQFNRAILPGLQHPDGLVVGLLVVAVALLRCGHQAGVNDLPAHHHVTGITNPPVQSRK